MMQDAAVGWNDPPKFEPGTQSSICPKRTRTRVFHSIDGRGGASNAATFSTPHSYGQASPSLSSSNTQQLVSSYPMQPIVQPTYPAPMPINSGYQQVVQPITYQQVDPNPLTVRLGNHINIVFGNPSMEIPSKDAILSSLHSLQMRINANQVSSIVQTMLNKVVIFLEHGDYQNAVAEVNALNSQHQPEVQPWIYAIHQLTVWSQSQASMR